MKRSCYIIADPNGVGKRTFARRLLSFPYHRYSLYQIVLIISSSVGYYNSCISKA
ncbi:hypothetical protein [Desulfothermus naphthae]